jgi:Uma2 family endonuclease
MATVQSPPPTETGQPEQRIILHGVSWETYERLLAEHTGRRSPRFAYDRGELEIMAPSAEHERDNWVLARIAEVVIEELGVEFDNLGMTTFRRPDLERGFEADTAFYLQHAADVRERTEIDLAVDPPPDLVIEVDVTSYSLDKYPIYAAIGVPEVWRCRHRRATINLLHAGTYAESSASAALPLLTTDILNQFLAEGRSLTRLAWLRLVRSWVQQQEPTERPTSSP